MFKKGGWLNSSIALLRIDLDLEISCLEMLDDSVVLEFVIWSDNGTETCACSIQYKGKRQHGEINFLE